MRMGICTFLPLYTMDLTHSCEAIKLLVFAKVLGMQRKIKDHPLLSQAKEHMDIGYGILTLLWQKHSQHQVIFRKINWHPRKALSAVTTVEGKGCDECTSTSSTRPQEEFHILLYPLPFPCLLLFHSHVYFSRPNSSQFHGCFRALRLPFVFQEGRPKLNWKGF